MIRVFSHPTNVVVVVVVLWGWGEGLLLEHILKCTSNVPRAMKSVSILRLVPHLDKPVFSQTYVCFIGGCGQWT